MLDMPHAHVMAASSRSSISTTWPSSMWAMRSPKWKTRLSWVTTTTARSGRTADSRSSCITVGRSRGRGRRSARRRPAVRGREPAPGRSPPAASVRRRAARAGSFTFLPMPMAARTSPARRTAGALLQPAITSGMAAFSAAVKAGKEVVLLEHEADVLGPEPRLHPIAHPGDVVAEDAHLARVGVEDAGDHREQAWSCRSPRARRSATSRPA